MIICANPLGRSTGQTAEHIKSYKISSIKNIVQMGAEELASRVKCTAKNIQILLSPIFRTYATKIS